MFSCSLSFLSGSGADGMYLENLGFEDGNTRAAQNEALRMVHKNKMRAMISVSRPTTLGNLKLRAENLSQLMLAIRPKDILLLRPFIFSEECSEIENIETLFEEMQIINQWRTEQPFHVAGLTIAPRGPVNQRLYDIAWFCATMYGASVFHVGSMKPPRIRLTDAL
jgi:hypothetical protein